MDSDIDYAICDEEIIIKKLQRGDREVYRFLFNTYYKLLCLYTTTLTKNMISSEDIVQNVFMNMWVKRNDLNIHSSIKNYLYKSVYNHFVNNYKKKQREEGMLDQIHYEVLMKSIEEEEDYKLKRLKWITKEIDTLPPKSREVFVMSKKRGLTHKEIAMKLNISENTVESHIGRALKRLRNRLPRTLAILF